MSVPLLVFLGAAFVVCFVGGLAAGYAIDRARRRTRARQRAGQRAAAPTTALDEATAALAALQVPAPRARATRATTTRAGR